MLYPGSYVDCDRLMATFIYGEKLGAPLAAALKPVIKQIQITAECHIRTPDASSKNSVSRCLAESDIKFHIIGAAKALEI
ncbi:MAG: hypothetical protein GY820_36670 [Gammaproteobacteria bacterium]|nr:hypothetical protein [Gammaproteobacteria bacterium]